MSLTAHNPREIISVFPIQFIVRIERDKNRDHHKKSQVLIIISIVPGTMLF